MRVMGKADQVLVRGAPRHVVAYLKEYLFDNYPYEQGDGYYIFHLDKPLHPNSDQG